MNTTDHLARIAAAIRDTDAQFDAAAVLPHGSDLQNTVRAARLARVCARRAAWWGVLVRVLAADPCVDWLHTRSAVLATSAARDDMRFWRETAADWLARHEQRPTSDAAGSLSNWHELGATA